MSKKRFGTAIPRLQQDYLNLKKDPVPYIRAAEPNPADMLEWHYVIEGMHATFANRLCKQTKFCLRLPRIVSNLLFPVKVRKILPILVDTIMGHWFLLNSTHSNRHQYLCIRQTVDSKHAVVYA